MESLGDGGMRRNLLVFVEDLSGRESRLEKVRIERMPPSGSMLSRYIKGSRLPSETQVLGMVQACAVWWKLVFFADVVSLF